MAVSLQAPRALRAPRAGAAAAPRARAAAQPQLACRSAPVAGLAAAPLLRCLAAPGARLGAAAPARLRQRCRVGTPAVACAAAAAAAPSPSAPGLLDDAAVSGALTEGSVLDCARVSHGLARALTRSCVARGVAPPGLTAAVARVRALCFYLVTVTLSLPLFVSMLLITPFQAAFDKHRRGALHFVNDLWAVCSTSLFYKVEARPSARAAALRVTAALGPAPSLRAC
jgi:hypothetical protein